jgi:GeoRSP system radical SAM/SPASM protein
MKNSDLLSAPLTVNWSLSYQCNFTCSHCYSRELETVLLSPSEIRSVVDLLAEKGVVFINFGGGEPLLLDDLYDITAYAVSRGLQVTMNTNGWLLDPPTAVRIAEAGFHSIGISVDSPDAKVHDRFRNMEGSFDRALKGLDCLEEAGVRSTVSCVINRENLHNWQGMIDLCRDHGTRTLYLHNYKCTGMGQVNMGELDLTPDQWNAFYTEALEVREGLSDLVISFDDPIMAALPGYSTNTAVKGSTCGKLSLHIEPDGGITPCGFIPVTIGNILNDDFDRIWFDSPVLEKMRSKTPTGKCSGCASYEDCLGGCSARAYAMTGSFDNPDPHCWVPDDPEKP